MYDGASFVFPIAAVNEWQLRVCECTLAVAAQFGIVKLRNGSCGARNLSLTGQKRS
jgi:hypothetical protein